MATKDADHEWLECDLTGAFAEWMASTEYREAYFEAPQDLELKLEEDFLEHVAGRVRETLTAPEAGDGSVVAVFGRRVPVRVRPRFGIDGDDRTGRKGPHRRVLSPASTRTATIDLLDARDGWNYLAVPITLRKDQGVHSVSPSPRELGGGNVSPSPPGSLGVAT